MPVLVVLVAAAIALPRPAVAHTLGLSTGDYVASGAVVRVTLTFALRDLAPVASLDESGDGHVSPIEVERARGELERLVLGSITITSPAGRCVPKLTDAVLDEDGLVLDASFACPDRGGDLRTIAVGVLDALPEGHRHLARGVGKGEQSVLLDRAHMGFSLEPAAALAADVRTPPARPARLGRLGESAPLRFFEMGLMHILEGPDHLVFLFALLLVPGRRRDLALVVTAFTIAHSMTLALAVTGAMRPSPALVEPAIALSIVYVGVENFFAKSARGRFRTTFLFGLVHGFGFASALAELALPRAELAAALVTFNLGVEAGQLLVLALLVPLVVALRKAEWLGPRVVHGLSGLVVVAGSAWFLARVG